MARGRIQRHGPAIRSRMPPGVEEDTAGAGTPRAGPALAPRAALAAHACSTSMFAPAVTLRRISPFPDDLKDLRKSLQGHLHLQ
jgi:hypothetical protein